MLQTVFTIIATYALTGIAVIVGYYLAKTQDNEKPKSKCLGARMNTVKNRKVANDTWSTPVDIVKAQVATVADIMTPAVSTLECKWVDPFKHTGRYYNNFPEDVEKDWCEITQGRDALKYNYTDTVVVSNPPYSILTPLLDKMAKDKAAVISLLILNHALTAPRLEKMEKAGYRLAGLTFCNVKGWFGAVVATWVLEFDESGYSAGWKFDRRGVPDTIINHIYKKGGNYEDNLGAH